MRTVPAKSKGRLRLRRPADVAVVEPTDVGQGNDPPQLRWLDGARLGCILLERKMRPRTVIVEEVAMQATTEMSFAHNDYVVEKFAAEGADHALGERDSARGSVVP